MKRYFYLLLVALFVSMPFWLISCGNDDENDNELDGSVNDSLIVGVWYITKTTNKYYTTIPEAQDYYNRVEEEEGNGEYWEFTSNKLTIHDPRDLANNKSVKYSYNKTTKELNIVGLFTYYVQKLTSSSMILTFETSDGNFSQTLTIEFSKRK